MCDAVEVEKIEPQAVTYERRAAIKMALGTACAVWMLTPREVLAKKVAIPLDKIKKLNDVGGSAILKVKGREVLFVRDSKTTIKALNPECTHKKCKVRFDDEKGRISCKCHKSAFELATGKVLDGPAPRPLQVYPASLDGGRIILTVPDEE